MNTSIRFKYFFICLYFMYSFSPIMIDCSEAFEDKLSGNSDFVIFKKLLMVDRLLSFLCNTEEDKEARDADTIDGILIKKYRILPASHSFLKQILVESRTNQHYLIDNVDILMIKQNDHFSFFTDETVPKPFRGYGAIHSGLSPPYLLS